MPFCRVQMTMGRLLAGQRLYLILIKFDKQAFRVCDTGVQIAKTWFSLIFYQKPAEIRIRDAFRSERIKHKTPCSVSYRGL
jgi:hypothetical protein